MDVSRARSDLGLELPVALSCPCHERVHRPGHGEAGDHQAGVLVAHLCLGFAAAVGRAICEGDLPHKDVSVFAAAWEAGVPATVHVGLGYDILHEHANFDPAATGRASYRDFLTFAHVVEGLEAGAVLCYGSAVMGPEVYLKALAMARNVAAREGREIRHFTSAVFDLLDLAGDLQAEAPRDTPEYYYRPYKTVLVRTVADGGQSHYVRGDHRRTLPALHRLLSERLET